MGAKMETWAGACVIWAGKRQHGRENGSMGGKSFIMGGRTVNMGWERGLSPLLPLASRAESVNV
ncbi:hypothetical protein [Lentibacillus amyloliquefaciens]|uniref:Uncharacterized protein n=1 Tax=Lentibacillus amyloliquefaciens TaxID=1472767 RepID=A0A0U4F3H9_9BACI|nr:hypothetical protein [Lentibacillus amyloliquefaciens]ALX50039.1 hypothetical protein AOX59_16510 [Lentibacillus amyloliquefaciens]